ncbi:hypothetical protein [Pseudogracilibacillus auburnensis]|uniref:hypothetical protein n=1 Tax=Pseudogracilibacillus auburnensis TaxID=1494959 RepID=UPI001A96A201|nr:hypothetical protein [Pseudogracilibacillus auburnensis]MBO1005040.1 hypothetical protein [Pseudogracilibacillus auburnensis]
MSSKVNALKKLFAETLQSMLKVELKTELGYEKYSMNWPPIGGLLQFFMAF